MLLHFIQCDFINDLWNWHSEFSAGELVWTGYQDEFQASWEILSLSNICMLWLSLVVAILFNFGKRFKVSLGLLLLLSWRKLKFQVFGDQHVFWNCPPRAWETCQLGESVSLSFFFSLFEVKNYPVLDLYGFNGHLKLIDFISANLFVWWV